MKTTNAITLTLLAIALLSSNEALAYSFNETSDGNPVRWNKVNVTITLDESLTLLGDMDQVENLVSEAFDQWVDTAVLPMEFSFERGDCKSNGYTQSGPNTNCISADENYTGDSGHTGATTTISFVDETGIIKDADMLINATQGMWTVGDSQGTHSLEAAILHEVGHVIGLSHSEIEQAVMAPVLSTTEDTDEDLHLDDIDGASTLYEDFSVPVAMMCSTATVGSTGPMTFLALLAFSLVLAVVFRVRRKRAAR